MSTQKPFKYACVCGFGSNNLREQVEHENNCPQMQAAIKKEEQWQNHEIEVSKGDKVEYEKDFDEIFRAHSTIGETYSVKYPGWMRDAFIDIMEYYGKSSLLVVTHSTIHGNELIKQKHEENLIEYTKLDQKLRHDVNGEIKDIVRDFETRIGDIGKFKTKQLRLEEGMFSNITKIASKLNLEFSSYCRICACVTFLKGEHILHAEDIMKPAREKVKCFEQGLEWHLDMLRRLNRPLIPKDERIND